MDSAVLKKDQPSVTVTGLRSTGLENSGSIQLVDSSIMFSNISIIFGDVAQDDTVLFVNNANLAGITVNDTIRIDNECMLVTRIDGTGCYPNHVTHPGCVSILSVSRSQVGTSADIHYDGSLAYKVVAGTLTDRSLQSDGSFGVGNQQTVINLDTVAGFSNVSATGDACYCIIDQEILKINQVIALRGTITSVVRDASGATAVPFPASWSGVNNYYQNMQLAFLDGAQQGRRRTVQQYDGRRRLASLDAQAWSVEVGANFTIRALLVDRGAHGTGPYPPVVSLGIVIPLGRAHRAPSPVYFTAALYPAFPDAAQWDPDAGTLQAALVADWPLGAARVAWVPVANPPRPQPPPSNLTIEVGRRPAQPDGTPGAYARFVRATVSPAAAAAAAAWPTGLPLFVCAPGTLAVPGQLNCTACGAGRFSDACGGAACPACPAATFTAAPAQTACTGCDAGYACPGGSDRQPCPAGWYSDASASACTLCPPRQYCPGQAAPADCPPGTSNALPGQSACAPCSPGNFSSEPAAAACSPCAAGAFAGSAGSSACAACAAGAFSAASGASSCDPCPEDQYQPAAGATACARCPANMGALLEMGLCAGACGGSVTAGDCLCKAGFTSFGQAGPASGCTAVRLESALVGQSTACAGGSNLLTVTFSANAALTTAVQSVIVLARGSGYVPGRIDVVESGGRYFDAGFAVLPDGGVRGVSINVPGRGFGGSPRAVKLFYAAGCAVNDTECQVTEQEGTIARIVIASAGLGYVPGSVSVDGDGGGRGLLVTFDSDACDALADETCAAHFGAVIGVSFATAKSHGYGYVRPPTLSLVYAQAVRCDDGKAALPPTPAPGCLQEGTITRLRLTGTRMSGCNTQTRIYAVGGGGSGFEALVSAVSPFGSILDTGMTIINHGAGYSADPAIQVFGPSTCECNGNASSAPGAFAGCLQLVRAHGAKLVAQLAGGAALGAVTGARLLVAGLPASIMQSTQVPVWSIPVVSVSVHTTQSYGILSDGSLISWGKSESIQTDSNVMVWRCGFKSRYFRFVTIAVRGGIGTQGVHLAEIELYAAGQKLSVVDATNPGGSNPPGFTASKAVDGDRETEWLDNNRAPIVLDLGQPYVIEKYRWMTAPDISNMDPISWRLEAFAGSNYSISDTMTGNIKTDNWITIHEMSKVRNQEYYFTPVSGSRNSSTFPRMKFTSNFTGRCNFPLYETWQHISLGFSHGCGLTTASIAVCWGRNDFGQLELPGESCSCPRVYGQYCSCKSANFDSQIYQKQTLEAAPSQCNKGKCYNTYSDGTCESQDCDFIYDVDTCRAAGIVMQLVPESTLPLLPQAVPIFPKGCYWIADPQVYSRLYFNSNNASSACTEARNCLCQNCPAFRFILFSSKGYCGGTVEDPASVIIGGTDLSSCTSRCGVDSSCDYFTFYGAESSVWCAPCCFRATSTCHLVDPDFVVPNVNGVKPTSKYEIISAGYLHTCGVISNGSAYCWGYDRNGQCDIPIPPRIRVWKSIAAGRFHSCGILDDSTVQCWGASNDNSINVGQVLPIPGHGAFKWLYISVGAWHSCGISDQGELLCWGCGGKDRLGRPIGVAAWGESVDKGQCKVPKGIDKWLSVSCGEYHTCGVTLNGSGYCWGCTCNPTLCPAWNSTDVDFGQCNIPKSEQWAHISAGMYHSCGLTKKDTIVCWGATPNGSSPFWNADGIPTFQDPNFQSKFNYGQTDAPSIEQWMNPALFNSFGTFDAGVLSLAVRENSLPGATYRFTFPILNPEMKSTALNLSMRSEGVMLSPLIVSNAPGPLGPARVVSCLQGTYNPQICIPCAAGTYAIDCGVSTCVACNPGQYSSVGESICSECPYGTFSALSGSTICEACPIGSFGNVTGAISAYDGCLLCEPGKFSDTFHQFDTVAGVWSVVGSSSCTTCPQGYYCLGGGSKIACPSGTWSDSEGATNSSACLLCSRPERCTNEWPRFVCEVDSGYANGNTFYDLGSCTKICMSFSSEPGRCAPQQGQNNGCSLGYAGVTCNKCGKSYHPDFTDEQCKPCPSEWSDVILIVVFAAIVCILLSVFELLQLDWRISAYCRSILIFLQFQDIFLSVNIRWPDFIQNYQHWLHLINFHVSSTHPECFLENNAANWFLLYKLRAIFPIIILGGLATFSVSPVLLLASNLRRIVSRSVAAISVWYCIPLALCVLSVFDCVCVPVGYELVKKEWGNCSNPQSRLVLTDDPYLICTDSFLQTAMSFSFWFILAIFVPIPAAIFLVIPQYQTPANTGTMTVNNFGGTDGKVSGSGWLHKVHSELVKSRTLLAAAKISLNSLYEIQLDEQAQGRKKEFLKAYAEYERLRCANQVYLNRHAMLNQMRAHLKDTLRINISNRNQDIRIEQLLAIQICRQRVNKNIFNFVNTLNYQKSACRRAAWVLNKAAFQQGKSWIQKSLVWTKWTMARRIIKKWGASKDTITKYIIFTISWFVSIFIMPLLLVFTVACWVWSKFNSAISPSNTIQIQYTWAEYGIRRHFDGQIVFFDQNMRFSPEFLRDKVALMYRGLGIMHESTLIKVERAVDAGAAAVILVNYRNTRFTPKVIAENFMLIRACNIPVIAISRSDANKIAEGSFISVQLKFTPELIGLRRLQYLLKTSLFGLLIESYRDGKQWFEIVIIFRGILVVCLSSFSDWNNFQKYTVPGVLFVQLVHFVFTLQNPYTDDGLNYLEMASSFCCLITALIVASVTSVLGITSETSAGLELKGTAGYLEDLSRLQTFYGMAYIMLFIFLCTFIYLIFLLAYLVLSVTATLMFRYCLKKPGVIIQERVHHTQSKLEAAVDPIESPFSCALHAISEFQRVLPASSLCDCSLTAVLGAISKQMEADEIKRLKELWFKKKYPWVYCRGIGCTGFCQGKEVMLFLNQFTGCIVEIAENSAGEIRFRPSRASLTYSLIDSIVWERGLFLAANVVAGLDKRPERYQNAVYAPHFGRWVCTLQTPDLEISHINKQIKVYLRTDGCAVSNFHTNTTLFIEKTGIYNFTGTYSFAKTVHDSRTTYSDALSAIFAAQRDRLALRKGPSWSRNFIPKPKSALEGILQALESGKQSIDDLDLLPESSFESASLYLMNSEYHHQIANPIISGIHKVMPVEMLEQENEKSLPENSPVVAWRKGGERRVRQRPSLENPMSPKSIANDADCISISNKK